MNGYFQGLTSDIERLSSTDFTIQSGATLRLAAPVVLTASAAAAIFGIGTTAVVAAIVPAIAILAGGILAAHTLHTVGSNMINHRGLFGAGKDTIKEAKAMFQGEDPAKAINDGRVTAYTKGTVLQPLAALFSKLSVVS